jgi:hypothetical protein
LLLLFIDFPTVDSCGTLGANETRRKNVASSYMFLELPSCDFWVEDGLLFFFLMFADAVAKNVTDNY